MALKLFDVKSLFVKRGGAGGETTVMDTISAGTPAPAGAITLPLIGKKPMSEQLRTLIALLVAVLGIIGAVVWYESRVGTHATAHASAAGQMRMLSQRTAKAAQLALQGSPEGFKELKESRDAFNGLIGVLRDGGEIEGVSVPASAGSLQDDLQELATEWEKSNRNAGLVLEQEKNLLALGKAVATINARNAQLLDLSEQVAALKLQSGSPAREISAASQLVMLTQRIAKNANALMVAAAIDPEVAFLLGKDTNSFRDLLQGLTKGSETLRIGATTDPETKERLAELDGAFAQYREAISGIVANLQRLVQSKQAGERIFKDSSALLAATEKLSGAYAGHVGHRVASAIGIVLLAALAAGILYLVIKLYNDDATRRRVAAENQRQQAEQDKNATQQAILRLMNEMGDLADGDLTVRATVTEDITGAIADSVNYTIEELSVLVKRINDAATRVTSATESAQRTSADLLAATERQSRELQDAGQAVLAMARSMNEVSGNALESADVARASLNAAQKGSKAVENSIKGMNEIREQIQETSKRIKRLGESSQEIGEIVELISDITEQTNVLALNAAIQAASAGEAGRGFTVVAEEVQRLAERSGEATKQIAAIVKTIQTDTHDAVSAMETSTRGVVEGTKLSDAAGQALSEISSVSNTLARLIEDISSKTQEQAAAATQVADGMKSILRVTQQTTSSTKETAVSIGQLAELAVELKGSVSGFKV
jgi:twitching motility protein PilJ